MKNRLLILFFLIFLSSASSQNESVKSLVDKTKDLNLDMWDLVEFAQKNIKEDIELARFFYYWIGSNIQYDYEFLRKKREGKYISKELFEKQDEYNVYLNRKGVCAGYTNLFKWFMDEVDIKSVYISGHIRDERNHYVQLESDDNFRHAWNAIKLNDKWMIIDTTWGTSQDSSVSDFYFDMKPEVAIISHFPKERKWQFLENPLSLEEFNRSKFIKPIWFFIGFSDIPKLKEDNNNYYFVYRTNPNKKWSVQLMYSVDNKNFGPIENTTIIDQDGFTYIRFNKTQTRRKAFYKVNIYLFKYYENIEPIYSNIINFKT